MSAEAARCAKKYALSNGERKVAITEGDDRDAALFNAAEVLTLCLEQRMEDGEDIPAASKVKGAEWVEPTTAVQAALLMRQARESQGKAVADMARALDTS